MNFLQLIVLVLGSAGLFASILGAFISGAARQNGRATRELIGRENKAMRELIERVNKGVRELIESENRAARELIETESSAARELAGKIGALIASEGQKTRDLIKSLAK